MMEAADRPVHDVLDDFASIDFRLLLEHVVPGVDSALCSKWHEAAAKWRSVMKS
jgi:hypothetical protein